MRRKTKEAQIDSLKSDISFMSYMIQKYEAQIKVETSTNGGAPDWWGGDHRLDGLDKIYKKYASDTILFLARCADECQRVRTSLEEKLSRLEKES